MRNFSRKERCDGLTGFHGRDKPPKPDREDSDGSKRDKGGEKNKVRAFPRGRSREWRENVSICGTESDFFEVHLPSFILRGYSPLDFTLVCDFHAEELRVSRLALVGHAKSLAFFVGRFSRKNCVNDRKFSLMSPVTFNVL